MNWTVFFGVFAVVSGILCLLMLAAYNLDESDRESASAGFVLMLFLTTLFTALAWGLS